MTPPVKCFSSDPNKDNKQAKTAKTSYLYWNSFLIWPGLLIFHNNDVMMSAMASQITNLTIVYSTVYSGADQRKHQSSASLPFVRGLPRWPANSPHKGPVTRKIFPFDDVIMQQYRVNNGSRLIQESITSYEWKLMLTLYINCSLNNLSMNLKITAASERLGNE